MRFRWMSIRHAASVRGDDVLEVSGSSDIPPSMRGWIQLGPETGRPGHYRISLRSDNAYGEPRSVLLTAADARRLHEVLGLMLQAGS
jgi:hypothetical protein